MRMLCRRKAVFQQTCHITKQQKKVCIQYVKEVEAICGQFSRSVLTDNIISSDDGEGNSKVEKTESFKVYFPNGTVSLTNGGQHNLVFRDLLQAAREMGQI
jgi:hypothetical protein